MPHLNYRRRMRYPREAVFDLVVDIESYPEFLPGWRHARILGREENVLTVEQELGIWGITVRFRTRATIDRPEQIHIETREHPFQYLDQYWRFRPSGEHGTLASLEADYALRDLPLRAMVTGLFDRGFRQTLKAFEERARKQLG